MNGQISNSHHQYRVVGDAQAGRLAAARLDRLVQTQLAPALDAALSQALGNDETVYVLRQVQAKLTLRVQQNMPDQHLMQRWAAQLAGCIMRAIARSEVEMVTFDNQAVYVAQFITDLINGRAHYLWYYHPFQSMMEQPLNDALQTVLLQNHHLPYIFQKLHTQGMMSSLLQRLGHVGRQQLWYEGVGAALRTDPSSIRPLFMQAARLLQNIGWQQHTFAALENQFHQYMLTRPTPTDWQSRHSLTTAVIDIIHFLHRQKFIMPKWISDRDAILADFDWLDLEQLVSEIQKLVKTETAGAAEIRSSPPDSKRVWTHLLRPQLATPQQMALLKSLLTAVEQGKVQLDAARPQSAANGLALYASVINESARWSETGITVRLIQEVLWLWSWWQQSGNVNELIDALAQTNVEAASQTFPQSVRAQSTAPLQRLAAFGETGFALLHQLDVIARSGQKMAQNGNIFSKQLHPAFSKKPAAHHSTLITSSPIIHPQRTEIATSCAGLFLLLRAVMDARLFAWVNQAVEETAVSNLSPLQTILLSMGLRWGGETSSQAGQIDEGLCLLSGLEAPVTIEDVRRAWSDGGVITAVPSLQTRLLQLLFGQRLLTGERCYVWPIAVKDQQTALIMGEGVIWPLGLVASSDQQATHALSWAQSVWQKVTGQQPSMNGDLSSFTLGENSELISTAHDEGVAQFYADAAQRLESDWQSMPINQLDLPSADVTTHLFALALLRIWARWLRQFADSSAAYLLTNFIQRPGAIRVDEARVIVEMAGGPLDIILEMAGYLDPIDKLPWLNNRRIEFSN